MIAMQKGVFAVLVLIVISLVGLSLYHHKYSTRHSLRAINNFIAAFDYDGQHTHVTTERLLNGDAVIILKIKPHKSAYYFNALQELQRYDKNKLGFIALDSPQFRYFYVGRYIKSKNSIVYQRLQKSGVSGIALTYIKGKIKSVKVILSDSSVRNLSIVAVHGKFLADAKLEPTSDLGVLRKK
jgi:hypothetical protein